jgi:hypothetical protein
LAFNIFTGILKAGQFGWIRSPDCGYTVLYDNFINFIVNLLLLLTVDCLQAWNQRHSEADKVVEPCQQQQQQSYATWSAQQYTDNNTR